MLRLGAVAKPSVRRLTTSLLRATMAASSSAYAPAVPAADKIICLGKK
jgi:hypothetical protein